MIYALAGGYAVVAIFFLCMAGYYAGKIGNRAKGLYNADLWQIRCERLMMGALPHLATFFLMVEAPIIYFRSLVIDLIFHANLANGDDYLLAAIVWLVWTAACLVTALCVVALAGTVYYRWKVADLFAKQE